jgi:23S rRNA (cytosine1962-C5)-methyltransferase
VRQTTARNVKRSNANALWLRKGADRRIGKGHQWIYSNEVDTSKTPLSEFSAGDLVEVTSSSGKILGAAYMEPQALICARLYARGDYVPLDSDVFAVRIRAALALRQRFYPEPYYRLIYGDSDGLSGLVVDRLGDYLVVQLNTEGLERYAETILDVLVAELKPSGIMVRGDSRQRRESELDTTSGALYGSVPEQVEIVENGVRFLVPAAAGQKTGWFYDHRDNRAKMKHYAPGSAMLDVYSYIGGWGVQAAAAGASTVLCVDSSEPALRGATMNAALNGLESRVAVERGAAEKVLQDLRARGDRFDLVVVDPPALIQRRRDFKQGARAYRKINQLALELLTPGGVLVSASCSMLLSPTDLCAEVNDAAARLGRAITLVEQGQQARDHPIHPAIPETQYLKALFFIVN